MADGSDALGQAAALFQEGRGRDAYDILAPAMAAGLGEPDAHQLMGLILHGLGDLAGCERELRTVLRMTPGSELAVHTLARILAAQDREDEAVAVRQAFVQARPDHPGAEYGLAAVLYGAGREVEAEAACRQAIAKGMDSVDAWMFLARLLNLQARFEEAQAAFQAAVDRDPLSIDAQRELSQLVWMRTGDVAKARVSLDVAPPSAPLTAVLVKLLQDAGEDAEAYAVAAERAAKDATLHVLAGRAALRIDPKLSDRHLEAAPPWANALARAKGRLETDLALGRGESAARRGEAAQAAYPQDHYLSALLATAWRMTGDPRYGQLYDYGRLVRTYRIEPPDGWSCLEAYLGDLGRALDRHHGRLTHPFGQSLRHGSQTQRSLMDYPDPEIRAFFAAIDALIRRHIAAIGEASQDYSLSGAWSVRLNRQGFHTDHVHPDGWLSSAFYVRVPRAEGHEGWLKFGEPGTPTLPALGPDHMIRPEPGMLVLFPSYMWHGTVPFSADETRLTCAFDVVRS